MAAAIRTRLTVPVLALALGASSAGFAQEPAPQAGWAPPIGPNPVFDTAPAAAPGHRLIVTDLNLGPDAVGDPHSHPWEEFLYVIAGEALVGLPGAEPQVVSPGETFTIPPRVVHTPKAGPDGVRAIVVRVHMADDPVTLP